MLAANLSPEDQTIQSMPDVSPTKWHLAHTSWFFETFVLGPLDPGYALRSGFRVPVQFLLRGGRTAPTAAQRGLMSRPTVDEVVAYRAHVTAAMLRLIATAGERCGGSDAAGRTGASS